MNNKNIARVAFTITSENGTAMYTEGQVVPMEIAQKYPKFMVGYTPPKAAKHDPSLPQRLSKTVAEKMTEERLLAWLKQYYPGSVPAEKLTKEGLVDLIGEVQGV